MPARLLAVLVPVMVCLAGCSKLPPDTREEESRQIQELERLWVQDYSTRALDSILARYADDATWMLPGKPQVSGRTAIREALKEFLADPNLALQFESARVEVSRMSDLAFSQGTYTLTRTDSSSRLPAIDKGKYVLTYRKQRDGAWRVVACIYNSDREP